MTAGGLRKGSGVLLYNCLRSELTQEALNPGEVLGRAGGRMSKFEFKG